MAGNGVNVSISEVVELGRDISSSLKTIHESNETMKQCLRKLGATFKDEGFDRVCGMVVNSEKSLQNATPYLLHIVEQLGVYADLLNRGKSTI